MLYEVNIWVLLLMLLSVGLYAFALGTLAGWLWADCLGFRKRK